MATLMSYRNRYSSFEMLPLKYLMISFEFLRLMGASKDFATVTITLVPNTQKMS